MATIRRTRARTNLAAAPASCYVANYREDGGLTFRIRVAEIVVTLTNSERDMIVSEWTRAEKEFLS